jgi:hypothetical protein
LRHALSALASFWARVSAARLGHPLTAEEAIYKNAKRNGEALAVEHHKAEAKPGYLPLVTAANVAPGAAFGGSAEAGTIIAIS